MPPGPRRSTDGDVITYRPAPTEDIRPRFWLVTALPLIWVALAMGIILDWRTSGAISLRFFCLTPAALVASVVAVNWGRRAHDPTSLTLTPEKLVYDGLDFGVSTTWDNVARLQDGPLPRLILRRRALTHLGLHSLGDAGLYVPLEPFRYTRSSQLAADLRRLAPHIFEA